MDCSILLLWRPLAIDKVSSYIVIRDQYIGCSKNITTGQNPDRILNFNVKIKMNNKVNDIRWNVSSKTLFAMKRHYSSVEA